MGRIRYLLLLMALGLSFCGCEKMASSGKTVSEVIEESKYKPQEQETVSVPNEQTPAAKNPSESFKILEPTAPGTETYGNQDVQIDASNGSEGYVAVSYKGESQKVRMLIETPVGNTYNYLVSLDKEYHFYPLSEGSGQYKIGVYENIRDDQYSMAFSQTIRVELKDDITAFLYPNDYVNFNSQSKAVEKAREITASSSGEIDKVEAVYHFVSENVTYDYDKAATVQSGYLPDVDATLAEKKGICFDYASLMGAMLRSQGIPTRLEIGYAGTEYHAWVSVYTKETGWIDGIIEFDGVSWSLMDPTLASYAKINTIKEHMESDSYYQMLYKY